MKSRRTVWLLVLVIITAMGLASRRYASSWSEIIARYGGDTMYAAAMFALVALLVPRWSALRVSLIALVACVLVELSQLHRAPWIDSIRATRIGGWMLGFGFLWSDLVCYLGGIGLMATLTWLVSGGSISSRRSQNKES